MNIKLNSLIAGITLAGASLAICTPNTDAPAVDQYNLPAFKVKDVASLPVPTRQIMPRVPSGLAGTTIEMVFTVNQFGYPKRITSNKSLFLGGVDDEAVYDFAIHMKQTLESWRFKPAFDAQGNPVAVKLRMPVMIVLREGREVAMVSYRLEAAEGPDRS